MLVLQKPDRVGSGALTITLATVSFQLLKAANRSPVLSLKTE
jgi:hypothetical protein